MDTLCCRWTRSEKDLIVGLLSTGCYCEPSVLNISGTHSIAHMAMPRLCPSCILLATRCKALLALM